MLRFGFSVLTLTAVAALAQAADSVAEPTAAQVRSAVERSVPLLERQGVAWFEKNKCIACHHGAWMTWSLNEARHAGISIDSKTYDAATSRALAIYTDNLSKKKTDHVQSTYMVLSQYDPAAPGKEAAEWNKGAIATIIAAQRPDGSWKYAGQGLDRPDLENDEATTLFAMLALPYGDKADAAQTAVREKAMTWLKTVKQGPSIDALALRLAVEVRFGDAAKVPAMRDELISRQNSDGGWSWKTTRASEAFATGEALYVLSVAGVKSDSPAVLKAWKFLVSTQKPDGSWLSPTRKPKGGNDISSYWGTTWAVIGLSRSLPPAGATASVK